MKKQQSSPIETESTVQKRTTSSDPENKVMDMDKLSILNFLHSPADLHIKNSKILIKTGFAIALILVALFAASYYISERMVAWLTLLIPLVALVVERVEIVRVTPVDILFHIGWMNAWGIILAMAFIGCFFLEFPVNGIFLIYYASMLIVLGVSAELLRLRYMVLPLCASIGIAGSSFRYINDPDVTIRAGLLVFLFFDIIAVILGGVTMYWQVKNKVKNPINFPQHTK